MAVYLGSQEVQVLGGQLSSGGGGAPTLQSKSKSYTPTESEQSETVTADVGYDGLEEVSVSVGAISTTYVGSEVTRKSAATYTPNTSTQTIAANQYLVGAQTINPIPSQYIVPSGSQTITSNGTYDVTNLASLVVNVSGGSGKNVQAYRGYDTVNTTSYSETDVTITVAKTGTYNVSWMGYRNTSSGTSGSQLYKNGTAVGTANTTFVNTYGHSVSLTNQSFNQGDVLVVRARARTTSYIMGVGNLIIEETE